MAAPEPSFELAGGIGVVAVDGTADEGRDQPVVLLGCGVAVSFVVTRRGWGVVVCGAVFSERHECYIMLRKYIVVRTARIRHLQYG